MDKPNWWYQYTCTVGCCLQNMNKHGSNLQELISDKRGAMFVKWRKTNGRTKSFSCTQCHHGLRHVMVMQSPYWTEHEVLYQSSEERSQQYVTSTFGNLNFCKYPEVPTWFLNLFKVLPNKIQYIYTKVIVIIVYPQNWRLRCWWPAKQSTLWLGLNNFALICMCVVLAENEFLTSVNIQLSLKKVCSKKWMMKNT